MLDSYVDAIELHINECVEDLDEVHQLLKQRSWTRLERKGAERTLQILVEACIGIAKHWSKRLTQTAPTDAYTAFQNIAAKGIEGVNHVKWRSVIGMRNALVHNYLNIEPLIIEQVIESGKYKQLIEFSLLGLKELE